MKRARNRTTDPGAGFTIEATVHFSTGRRRARRLVSGPPTVSTAPVGRVPRISRLMALAIHFDGLIHRGLVRDYADLARLGHLTRACVTQIMGLLNLAPDIQEELLLLPATSRDRDPFTEREMRAIVALPT